MWFAGVYWAKIHAVYSDPAEIYYRVHRDHRHLVHWHRLYKVRNRNTRGQSHPRKATTKFIFSLSARDTLNSNRTGSLYSLSDARQLPARPYPIPARFQLWWGGQTFYSTRPIIGIFDLTHLMCALELFSHILISHFISFKNTVRYRVSHIIIDR